MAANSCTCWIHQPLATKQLHLLDTKWLHLMAANSCTCWIHQPLATKQLHMLDIPSVSCEIVASVGHTICRQWNHYTCLHLGAEVHVQSQEILWECGGHSGSGASFSLSLWFSPAKYYSTNAPHSAAIGPGTIGPPNATVKWPLPQTWAAGRDKIPQLWHHMM
jgi:hypothetical protein